MKSKKIVYFGENLENKPMKQAKDSTAKSNASISKYSRESSINKIQNYMINLPRLSGEKVSSLQKIKILIRKDGFIFEKKYLIFDINCTLIKKSYGKYGNSKGQKQNLRGQISDQMLGQQLQDFLYLNIQPSSFGITKGLVKLSFPIEKDGASYVEVKATDYILQNVMIHNKRVQLVQLSGAENIDDQDLTIIQPIKLIEQSQRLRASKIKNFFQMKLEGNQIKKNLNFCWNLDPNVQNSQPIGRNSVKRNEPQWSLIFHNLTNTINTTSSAASSERSSFKGNKSINLLDLMKTKDIKGAYKASSKKILNDSGIFNSGTAKKSTKENNIKWKQDVYGLAEMRNKKSRVKNQ